MTRFTLVAPNGQPIVGTLERCRGLAEADEFTIDENGALEPLYTGSTNWFYDEQRTVEENGEPVVLDEQGNEHLLSTCTRVPVAETE